MTVVTLVQDMLWAVAAWSAFFSAWLGVMLTASLFRQRLPNRISGRKVRRFFVLIPAHDEESTVARAIRSAVSVRKQRIEVRVLVIADNCSDRTAEVAAGEGAAVAQ